MRFDGDSFYSFATVIAYRIKFKGREAYILDRASFSSTTSGHQSSVIGAIKSSDKKFLIDNGRRGQSLDLTPSELRDHYLSKFNAGSDYTSRYAHKRAGAFLLMLSHLDNAIEVCEYFKLAVVKLKKLRMSFDMKAAELRNICGDYDAKLSVRREAKWKREDEERERRRVAAVAEAISRAERFIAGETPPDIEVDLNFGYEEQLLEGRDDLKVKMRSLRISMIMEHKAKHVAKQVAVAESFINKAVKFDPEHYFGWKHVDLQSRPDLIKGIVRLTVEANKDDIEKWLAGENVRLDYDLPPHFRVEADEVVTSKGARFPINHAERSFKFCMAMREKGWKRNGHTHHVGMYQIDEISNKEIVAGCHHVQWSILIEFGKKMGWVV